MFNLNPSGLTHVDLNSACTGEVWETCGESMGSVSDDVLAEVVRRHSERRAELKVEDR